MTARPRTALMVPGPSEEVTENIQRQVREKLNSLQLVPEHYRTPTQVLFGLNNTLPDVERYMKQRADADRARAVAVRASGEHALAVAALAEIPQRAAWGFQQRAREHDVAMLELDFRERSIRTAMRELDVQIAGHETAIKRLEYERSTYERSPGGIDAGAAGSERVRLFKQQLAEDQAVRAERDAQIAQVRRLKLSEEEKARRIKAIEEAANELLSEGDEE